MILVSNRKITVQSPGRINLIGEHTDYNLGFVLPAAINKYVTVEIEERNDELIELISINNQQTYRTSLSEIHQSTLHWPDYALGVVSELQKANHSIKGFSAIISGNIPVGAGLSSSAAYECAMVFALNEVFNLGLTKQEMVQLAQAAENNFVGLQCGIMDMFASMMGKENHAIRLDCRSLDYEYFPVVLGDFKIVLLDTQVKHSLASSEYNTRRKECEIGINLIKQKYPSIQSLRDATLNMVNDCITDITVKKRCTFIVEEIERVLNACTLLNEGKLAEFGREMYATHNGLSRQYEVSCQELDFLVNECLGYKEILGARMMGGGFGGCIISLMHKDAIDNITGRMASLYKRNMQKEMLVYVADIVNGTNTINKNSP
ncbi:MAG: galactokinase [Sphingobacteriia bacterium]|nr:galactokinase [Sphingobacteriia bacterium]